MRGRSSLQNASLLINEAIEKEEKRKKEEEQRSVHQQRNVPNDRRDRTHLSLGRLFRKAYKYGHFLHMAKPLQQAMAVVDLSIGGYCR